MSAIPLTPEQITNAWLDEVLHDSGVLTTSRVIDSSKEVIGEGQGLLGQLARVSLTYDAAEPSAPTTLIAKMATEAKENRQIGMGLGVYEREVCFYRELAPACPVRIPVCYHADLDADDGSFILLLEDLSALHAGDQVVGATAEQARHAMRACARINALWWNRGSDYDWIPPVDDEVQIMTIDAPSQSGWDPFVETFGEETSPQVLEVLAGVRDDIPGLMRGLRDTSARDTLVHGDLRLDNMFFGAADEPFALIDWQLLWRSGPGVDLAWFVGQSMEPEVRRACEQELIDLYLAELQTAGVRYDAEECWRDYRRGLLLRSIAPVVLSAVDVANERGRELVASFNRRAQATIVDHDLGSLL